MICYLIITIILIISYLVIQHFIFKKWEEKMIKNLNRAFDSLKAFIVINILDRFTHATEQIEISETDEDDTSNNDTSNIV
jgi:hypothetical protein